MQHSVMDWMLIKYFSKLISNSILILNYLNDTHIIIIIIIINYVLFVSTSNTWIILSPWNLLYSGWITTARAIQVPNEHLLLYSFLWRLNDFYTLCLQLNFYLCELASVFTKLSILCACLKHRISAKVMFTNMFTHKNMCFICWKVFISEIIVELNR